MYQIKLPDGSYMLVAEPYTEDEYVELCLRNYEYMTDRMKYNEDYFRQYYQTNLDKINIEE